MHGSQVYKEGAHKPECFDDIAYVWCKTGALNVLQSQKHKRWLQKSPANHFIINFGNGSFAMIQYDEPLWKELVQVAEEYDIYVFTLKGRGEYIPWTGDAGSLNKFDAIRIQNKGQPAP